MPTAEALTARQQALQGIEREARKSLSDADNLRLRFDVAADARFENTELIFRNLDGELIRTQFSGEELMAYPDRAGPDTVAKLAHLKGMLLLAFRQRPRGNIR